MGSTRAMGGAPGRRGRAVWLALPLAASLLGGCKEGESVTWVGVQDCAVGIPPETASNAVLASSQLSLEGAQVTQLGSGFIIRNFSLGPVGGFRCEAPELTARFVASSSSTLEPGAAPGPGRPLQLLPFECRGTDGRTYLLDGEGQADDDALFFNQIFTAWLGAERGTLVCATRFQRQVAVAAAPDAGSFPAFGPLSE